MIVHISWTRKLRQVGVAYIVKKCETVGDVRLSG
jgi:hypothetical protein